MRVRRWLPWMALVVVLGGALAVAAGGAGSSSRSPVAASVAASARVVRITSEIRCPTCRGLSAAQSDAETARAIRTEVAKQVGEGRSDGEILAFMRDRYGSDILLRPPASGFAALVWALPVVAFVLAVGGLALAFRRWNGAEWPAG